MPERDQFKPMKQRGDSQSSHPAEKAPPTRQHLAGNAQERISRGVRGKEETPYPIHYTKSSATGRITEYNFFLPSEKSFPQKAARLVGKGD